MKNIVITPEDKIKVLTSCGRFPANGYFTFKKEDAEVEKVPTNWGELKELCKKLKEEDILVMNDCIVFRDLNFDKSGMICVPTNGYFAISIGRTPQQMWGIIKNLIGE